MQKILQDIQKMKYAQTRYVTMQLTQWFQPQEATIISFTKSWSTVILKVSQHYLVDQYQLSCGPKPCFADYIIIRRSPHGSPSWSTLQPLFFQCGDLQPGHSHSHHQSPHRCHHPIYHRHYSISEMSTSVSSSNVSTSMSSSALKATFYGCMKMSFCRPGGNTGSGQIPAGALLQLFYHIQTHTYTMRKSSKTKKKTNTKATLAVDK